MLSSEHRNAEVFMNNLLSYCKPQILTKNDKNFELRLIFKFKYLGLYKYRSTKLSNFVRHRSSIFRKTDHFQNNCITFFTKLGYLNHLKVIYSYILDEKKVISELRSKNFRSIGSLKAKF